MVSLVNRNKAFSILKLAKLLPPININPFSTNVPFLYPLRTSGTLVENGLIFFHKTAVFISNYQ